MRALAPALLLLALSAPADAGILCVKPGGGSGCHATIPSALAAADDGDTIRIAAGTYAGNLLITENVTLEGGWNSTFAQRDPDNFITRVIPSAGSTLSVVSIIGSGEDPIASTPIVDGITITGGRADLGNHHGGGLRVVDSHAQIFRSTITGNRGFLVGGGLWVIGGSTHFEDSRIDDNEVTSQGTGLGAGVMIENASASFLRCSISRNRVVGSDGVGGGIAIRNLSGSRDEVLRVEDSVLDDNSAGIDGIGFGGAIAAQVLDSPAPGVAGVFLDRVRVRGNSGRVAGGALSFEEAPFDVRNSLFIGNAGGLGNAIFASDFSSAAALSPGIVRNSTFIGTGSGSAIETDSPLAITNSVVVHNGTGVVYSGPQGGFVASHNDFFANGADVSGGVLDATHLHVDPRLDATGHLLPDSPLVDAGRRTDGPFADVDGDPRPAAGPGGRFGFDIGADEAPGEAQRVFRVDRGEADLVIVGPGGAGGESLGHSLLGGDWSGDGADDLLLVARDWGRAFGLLGSGARTGGVLDLALAPGPDLQLQTSPRLPLHSTARGDVDGDGKDDVALGSAGRVFVRSGGDALRGTQILSAADADFSVIAADPGSSAFAQRGALAIGDVSGDGIADLVVGDARADDAAAADAGAVFVIFGSPALSGVRDLALAPADASILGPQAGARLGSALALADLDGDGDLDLAASDTARTHLLFGPLAPGVRRLAVSPAPRRIANLGAAALIALDLSGEGHVDLVGAGSQLRMLRGPFAAGPDLDAASAASLELTGSAPPGALAAADVLGDARAELLVGLAGSAYAISAGASASGSLPLDQLASLAVVDPANPAGALGSGITAADLDADGRADLLVGDPGAGDPGRAYLFYGGLAADVCPGLSDPEQLDGDADGAGDACDRCPLAPDPLQRDLGGIASPADPSAAQPDGIGDACQCGDASGDGRGTAADLVAIRQALLGALALAAPAKCNVRGPLDAAPRATGLRADCSIADAAVLARQLAGLAPGVAQVCAPALGAD